MRAEWRSLVDVMENVNRGWKENLSRCKGKINESWMGNISRCTGKK